MVWYHHSIPSILLWNISYTQKSQNNFTLSTYILSTLVQQLKFLYLIYYVSIHLSIPLPSHQSILVFMHFKVNKTIKLSSSKISAYASLPRINICLYIFYFEKTQKSFKHVTWTSNLYQVDYIVFILESNSPSPFPQSSDFFSYT